MKTLNEWMDERGMTAEEAAEIFRKSAGTIRNWRSLGVPESQIPWVQKVMLEHETTKTEASRGDRIWLELTDEQLRAYDAAARVDDLYWKDWAVQVLDEAAEDHLTGSDGSPDTVMPPLCLADDPKDYPLDEMGA